MEKEDQEEQKIERKVSISQFKDFLGIFSYIRPYMLHFVGAMALLVLGSLLFLAIMAIPAEMVNVANGDSDRYSLKQLGLALLVMLLVQSVFSYFRVILFAHVSEKGMADLRKSVYAKLLSLPVYFFEKNRVGALSSRITEDVAQLQSVFSYVLAEFIRQLIILIAGLVILFVMVPRLSLIMFATFPVVIVGVIAFGRFVKKLSKERQKTLADTNIRVVETLMNVNEVSLLPNESLEQKNYGSAMSRVVAIAIKLAKYKAAMSTFIVSGLFGALFFVLYQGFVMVSNGKLDIGVLVLFITYTAVIGGSIFGLSNFYTEIVKAIGGTERLREILTEDSELQIEDGMSAMPMEGKFNFDKVEFNYPTRPDIPVLRKVSLEVLPGEKIALVGQSGSGKSTIARLLMRFYNPSSGAISVDGQDIKDLNYTAYRKNIGIVPQDVVLFGGSIKENIAYGNPAASDDLIIDAAKKSYCWEFIQKFPEGVETIVGERGVQLSGGQRQRVAIARAILKNPTLLILDEATSSLDAESEKLVQDALEELMRGRTSVIIAHRLSTIRDCDRIYVLDNGQLMEQGSHEELLKKEDGLYQNLVKLQFESIET